MSVAAKRESKVDDPEFRQMRARCAGLERVNKQLKGELAEERERADALADRLADQRAGLGDTQPAFAAMRADLIHAVECTHGSRCLRCYAIARSLGDTSPTYATAVEVSERINEGRVLREVGEAVIAAHKSRGVGAAHARLVTLCALRDVLEDGKPADVVRRELAELGIGEWLRR